MSTRTISALLALTLSACAPELGSHVAQIGETHVYTEHDSVLPWDALPEYLVYLRGEAILHFSDECPEVADGWAERGFAVDVVLVPPWSLVESDVLASGRYMPRWQRIDVRWVPDVSQSALAHEIFEHFLPHVCEGDSSANADHARPDLTELVESANARWQIVYEETTDG